MGGYHWTEEDDDWLRKNYPGLGANGCYKAGPLGRTLRAIHNRAQRLGLVCKRRWTEGEDAWIKEHYPKLGAKGCYEAGHLDKTYTTIKARAFNLGVTFDREVWNRKQSAAIKAAWKRGDIGDEEWLRQHAEAMERRWQRGDMDDLHSEEWCHQQSEAMKAAWERGDFDDRKVVCQSPTGIELEVAAALEIMGIERMPQYRPDGTRYTYDEFVFPNILIEVNGDYWHGDNFPEQQQRDVQKAQWAEDNGYKLVTIWEHEIKQVGAWALVMQRVAGIEEEA